jgi:hypothetical protein
MKASAILSVIFLSRTDILDADAIRLVVLFFTVPPLLWILVPPFLLQFFQFPFVQKLQNSVE